MKVTNTTHFWFTKLAKTFGSWFDLGLDLDDLSITEEEVNLDLTTGCEESH